MDGILIDTEPIWRRVEIEVFGRVGLHLTEAQCMQTMGVRVAEVVQLWYDRHPWEGPTPAQVTEEIVRAVIAHVLHEGEPLPGVIEALSTIRDAGLPVAIASSSGEELIGAVVSRLGIGEYIDAIASGENEAEGKPHPAVYLRAASALGLPPSTCLAIEDSPNGVLSAKAAGMYCIVIPDPHLASDPRLLAADLRLPSLLELTAELLATLSGGTPETGAVPSAMCSTSSSTAASEL